MNSFELSKMAYYNLKTLKQYELFEINYFNVNY